MPRDRRAAHVILAAALVAALVSPRPASAAEVQRARVLMGTVLTAMVEAPDTVRAAAAIAAAFDEVAALERVMSSWRGDSELARLNASATNPFACSPDLFAVLDSALAVARACDGAFDPTVEPLMRAWDLRGTGRIPSPAERGTARAAVGWRGLDLDRDSRTARFARPGMGVDLGGIGKGFALDRVVARLRSQGIERAVIDFGGQVATLGARDIAIAHPADRLQPLASIRVVDASASTSAQSEQGFERRGHRYGHILDPRTGEPVQAASSVTVVCRPAGRADALSTALLVMGREAAADWARHHADTGVVWLEPSHGSVRGWAWNLSPVTLGHAVDWMDDTRHTTLLKGHP